MSRVLIVDPSVMTQGYCRDYFVSLGHEVVACGDGFEAIREIDRWRPDLVVADPDVSRVSGVLLLRYVRGRVAGRVRFALYGGESGRRKELWGRLALADAWVEKDEDGLEAIRRLLDAPDAGADSAANTRTTDAATEVPSVAEAGGAAPSVSVDRPDRGASNEEPGRVGEEDPSLIETVSAILDRGLFHSGVAEAIWSVAAETEDVSRTVEEILTIVRDFADASLAAVVLRYGREARGYFAPGTDLVADDVEQFGRVCFEDFFRRPGTEAISSRSSHILGVSGRTDFDRTRIDGRRLSSYFVVPLFSRDGAFVGTLHVGDLLNNAFVGLRGDEIEMLSTTIAGALHQVVRFHVTEDTRKKINTIFAKFVPQEVIEDLLSQSDDAEMAVGEKRSVAILFSDIRSFTVMSEHNSAEKIVSFLNTYLERMVRIIREHGGFVDKFIGDAILAIFGAPISYEDNAARAVRAARQMAASIGEIDVGGLVLPDVGFATGIGVHEGTVIVGNIGSSDKFDYTVIGDNVNLASRLEGLTKHYHAQVLLSDVVRTRLPETIPVREVDTVRVKGKEQATTLYAVPGAADTLSPEASDHYHKALSMYKLMNWATATDYFRRVLAEHPDDYLASMYIDRCREFANEPPPADWGGAVKLDFK